MNHLIPVGPIIPSEPVRPVGPAIPAKGVEEDFLNCGNND
jgi:hypothetical protein